MVTQLPLQGTYREELRLTDTFTNENRIELRAFDASTNTVVTVIQKGSNAIASDTRRLTCYHVFITGADTLPIVEHLVGTTLTHAIDQLSAEPLASNA